MYVVMRKNTRAPSHLLKRMFRMYFWAMFRPPLPIMV